MSNFTLIECLKVLKEDIITFWLCEDKQGNEFEILVIDNDESYNHLLKTIIDYEVKPLIKNKIKGIQKIIETGFDSNTNNYFIVYERLEDYKNLTTIYEEYESENRKIPNLDFIKDITAGLDTLKKDKRQNYIIAPNSICIDKNGNGKLLFVGLYDFFERLDLLDKNYLAPNVIEWVNRERELAPNFQDDMFSLVKIIEDIFDKKPKSKEIKQLLETGLHKERTNRFSKYYEIIDLLEKASPATTTIQRNKSSEKSSLKYLVNSQKNVIKNWKTLPENEKESIEKNAFSVNYISRKQSKKKIENIIFEIDSDNKVSLTKIRELRKENVILHVNDQRIGKILDYNKNENILILKDVKTTLEEIPEKGKLIEDISQEISQYKKQLEACQKFESFTLVNPKLCDILATPNTQIKNRLFIKEREYEDFTNKLFNENLKNDETQRKAVLEALNYKPLYLIQGPPGTGKTTVIVEMIQQLISQKSDIKILVTSQSNLAVDNVLEKLKQINEEQINTEEKNRKNKTIDFIRLVSQDDAGNSNVTEAIAEHTFETLLPSWTKETENKSRNYFSEKFKPINKGQKELIQLYDFYSDSNKKTDKDKWNEFRKKLEFSPYYLQKLFKNINNLEEAKQLFEKELGEYLKSKRLEKLQQDWFSFIGNAPSTDENKKSFLNNGSRNIDFLEAMMQKMTVFGATCIHIASGKYSNINFKFDYVIMDESSKATPAETLVPITMGENIVLIGDHRQLPPVITRKDDIKDKIRKEQKDNGLDIEKEFGTSLFETLINAFENDELNKKFVQMLNIQYRMPKQIGTLISKYFYDGKLQNSENNIDKPHNLSLKKQTSILFITTSNKENRYDNDDTLKRQNKCNVETIDEILYQLNKSYSDNLQKEEPFTIGIIAGYRGQVELLKKDINLSDYKNFILKKESNPSNLIEINTVDKFQGAERDIIIYDIVRSSERTGNIGFLEDYRRINVAFSRAKRLLIIVGDSEYLLKRAKLRENSNFSEFKLQQITQELQNQNLIFNNLNEILL